MALISDISIIYASLNNSEGAADEQSIRLLDSISYKANYVILCRLISL